MFLKNLNKKLIITSVASGILISLASCSLLNEDLSECPVSMRVRFIYDYNLKFADAFAHEVKSVNVWAFDTADGTLVWSDSASGEELADKDFALEAPLTEGTYDFVAWCGLKDNEDFNLATYTPASKEELEVKLRTVEKDGLNISSSHLPGLYHGTVLNDTFTVNPTAPTIKTLTIPLMKDTNDIRVLLARYNGTAIGENDFDVKITIPDAWLGWNNNVLSEGPMVTYTPWDVSYGYITTPDNENDPDVLTTFSTAIFDLSSSRLIKGANATLTVRRNSDNTDIIRIPIIEYFLLVKGHYGDMTDQSYLDRQDDYSIMFFVDEDNNLYAAGGIYINSWAVVPPQNTTLQ